MLLRTLLFTAVIGMTTACSSAGGESRDATPDAPMTLSVGERATLPDRATLRFVGVRDDSRCPPGVQCIRAGDAKVDFELVPVGGATQPLTLNEPEQRSGRVGDWTVAIEGLTHDSSPRVTVRVTPAP